MVKYLNTPFQTLLEKCVHGDVEDYPVARVPRSTRVETVSLNIGVAGFLDLYQQMLTGPEASHNETPSDEVTNMSA